MAGKFVITTAKNGEFTFNLKASNGEVVLTASETYTSLSACENGIESVKKNAGAAIEDQTREEKISHPKFELYKDKGGEFRFRLKAGNGQIVAVGEGYKAKAGCLNGIESIKKNATTEMIEVVPEEA